MLPKEGQQFENQITEGEKAFGSITDGYTTLKDLGTDKLYDHFSIESTLDNPVTLRIGGTSEITFSNEVSVFDKLVHNGLLEIKHNGVAPTSGYIKTRSW